MEPAGGGAPLENTRTIKVKHFTPQHGTSDVWKHFHLREACLEVKTPGGKKAPLSSSAARLVRAELSERCYNHCYCVGSLLARIDRLRCGSGWTSVRPERENS